MTARDRSVARRYPLLPSLTMAVMLAVLLALGLWQVQRAGWKEALLARYRANSAVAPVRLADLPVDEPAALEFRRVRLDCEVMARGLTFAGGNAQGEAGQHLFVPCRAADRALVVDLGWLPFRAPAPDLTGARLAAAGVARTWQPATAMERLAGARRPSAADFPGVEPRYFVQAVRLDAADGAAWPEPSPLSVAAVPNNHRAYAVQWFAFAAVLAVIYGLYLRRWRMLQREKSDDTVRRS